MKKLIFISALSLLSAAFLLLVAAMIFHAVEGNNSTFSVLFAVISAASAFLGIIILLIFCRGNRYENK